MKILIYEIDKDMRSQRTVNKDIINVHFILNSNEEYTKTASWKTVIKKVCEEYVKEKRLNMKSLIFKYSEEKINLNKKFIDIANEFDKKCNGIIIKVYTGHQLKVTFSYEKSQLPIDCLLEDKIKDIIKDYLDKKSLNIEDIEFFYKKNLIQSNSNQTFQQMIQNIDYDATINNLNIEEDYSKEINEINITVKKKKIISKGKLNCKINVVKKRKQ